MPTPRREAIMLALLDKLGELTATMPALEIVRNPPAEISRFPTIALLEGGHEIEGALGGDLYKMTPLVEIYIAADDGAALGAAANDLHARVMEKLYEDRTLGGVAVDLIENGMTVDRESEKGSRPYLVLGISIGVTFVIDGDSFYVS